MSKTEIEGSPNSGRSWRKAANDYYYDVVLYYILLKGGDENAKLSRTTTK